MKLTASTRQREDARRCRKPIRVGKTKTIKNMKKVLLTIAAVAFAFAANAQFVIGGQLGFTSNGGHMDYTAVAGSTTTAFTVPGSVSMAAVTAQKTMALTIMPKVGYQLNDQMQAGLSFGIANNKTIDYSPYANYYSASIEGFEGYVSRTSMNWVVAPYFRYNFAEMGNFTLFCEAQITLMGGAADKIHEYNTAVTTAGVGVTGPYVAIPATDTTYKDDTKSFTFGFSVVPGLNYKLGESCSLDLYVDLFRLGFTSTKTTVFQDNTVPGGATNTREMINVDNNFYFGLNASARDLNTQFGWFRLGFNFHF